MSLCFDSILSADRARQQLEEIQIYVCMEMGQVSREEAIRRIKKSNEEHKAHRLNQNLAENCP